MGLKLGLNLDQGRSQKGQLALLALFCSIQLPMHSCPFRSHFISAYTGLTPPLGWL